MTADETRTAHPRAFHIAKECSQYTGLPGSYCTITSSDVAAIAVGSKVVYAAAAGEATIDSDLEVHTGGARVFGHVVLDLVTSTGAITFEGGTGELAGFCGYADVTLDGDQWQWNGSYRTGVDDEAVASDAGSAS